MENSNTQTNLIAYPAYELREGFYRAKIDIEVNGYKFLYAIAYGDIKKEVIANAKLIAEAGTVANETGFSPRELADQKAELLEALQSIMGFVVSLELLGHFKNYENDVSLEINKSTKAIKNSTLQ